MRFEDIDLARLPPPIVPAPSYEAIRTSRLTDLSERLNAAGIAFDASVLETDALVITEEAGAYREMLAYARRNDAVKAVMLATAWGVFLDHLGGAFGVVRKVMTPATNNTPAVMEKDSDFRVRIQLVPEAFSTCGPEGAYLYFSLIVEGVKSAAVYSRMSTTLENGVEIPVKMPIGHPANTSVTPMIVGLCEVHVPILAATGNGQADIELMEAVDAALSAKDRRPIADCVYVTAAKITEYDVVMKLIVGRGVDPEIVRVEAQSRVENYVARQHRVGASLYLSGLHAAGHVPDDNGAALVEEVIMVSPQADIHPGPYGAAFCKSIILTIQAVNG